MSFASTQNTTGRPRLLQAALDAFKQPDIRSKLLFVIGALIVFRFVAHVPVPGVNPDRLQEAFSSNAVLGFLNIFSGGALQNLCVVRAGVRDA